MRSRKVFHLSRGTYPTNSFWYSRGRQAPGRLTNSFSLSMRHIPSHVPPNHQYANRFLCLCGRSSIRTSCLATHDVIDNMEISLFLFYRPVNKLNMKHSSLMCCTEKRRGKINKINNIFCCRCRFWWGYK